MGVGLDATARRIALDGIFRCLDRKTFKVHLLGLLRPQMISMFKPDSVDSSVAISKAKIMNAIIYDGGIDGWREEKIRDLSAEDKKKYLMKRVNKIAEMNRDYIEEDSAEIEVRMKLLPAPFLCVLVNAWEYVRFERYVRQNVQPEFRYLMTLPLTYLRNKNLLLQKFLSAIWKDRSLVSYAHIYGSQSVEHEYLDRFVPQEQTL